MKASLFLCSYHIYYYYWNESPPDNSEDCVELVLSFHISSSIATSSRECSLGCLNEENNEFEAEVVLDDDDDDDDDAVFVAVELSVPEVVIASIEKMTCMICLLRNRFISDVTKYRTNFNRSV
jgi:myo-inositol-hexaphosphate 3-phosphohydrolase